ncbi:MAG TPA: tetratricopeptide repeat protein [candidate division WOR-3 bacterium]|uniref:Tetratricopeptide repeat protein n=1 Tax=candidate division WOR-3 bacterium TaxID=2052148 RepID=A0A9C9JZG3_UNCW3|nr:tetratricopeptide repeat protein [candidate division WOR-3 bacterium]
MKNSLHNECQKERRLVTILFADLSGFTALSENLDPEELNEALNICFEILNRIISKYGGTIHKYEGDSVLAVFGLPQAHEDDPERGVKTALEMMERIPEINKALGMKLKADCDLGLHIGINLGTVFAGTIGSREKKEYTIIGEAVNMASRLMDAADDREILVSGRVFRQTRYLFEYQPLKPIHVKGISRPVQIFRPLKIKDKADPKRGIEGFESVMVGRDKELALLHNKAQLLYQQKKGGVVFVLGEAGIGKSRLYNELKRRIISETIPVKIIEGRCLSYGEMITYHPILQIIKQLFHISDKDTMDIIKQKVLSVCKKLLPHKDQEVVPYILYLLSIPLPKEFSEKVKHLDAEGLNLQMFVALKILLHMAAKKTPLLVIIEDYHWIDDASLDFLKFIFDTTENEPILLLCLSRFTKETHGYEVKEFFRKRLGSDFTEIELHVLSDEVSQQLTDNLLKVSGLSEEVQRKILDKAEGNPLFLEEIIRSLIDRGLLIRESGTWKASDDLDIDWIPDSIQEIIATRIDNLEPNLKVILQKAAVIGRNFLVHLLECLTGIDSLMMSVHLATLEELEYIRLLTKEPQLEYTFKHPLVREVVYNSLPKKERRELHGQIAEIMEEILVDRLDEFTDFLALHYANSDEKEKAIVWLEKAGFRAKEQYANKEAVKYFEKVISLFNRFPEVSTQDKMIQVRAYEALGDVNAIRGAYEAAINAYASIINKSENLILRARAQRKTARVYWHQSNFTEALDFLDKSLEILSDDSDDALLEQAEVYLLRGAVYEVQGAMEEARKSVEKTLNIIERISEDERVKKIRAKAYISLAGIFRNHGDYDKAIKRYEQSRVLLEELNDKQVIGNVMYLLGIVYHMKGDYKKAIELNEQSRMILEQIGDKKNIGRTYTNLGIMYSYLEKGEKVLDFHRKALQISLEIGDRRGEGFAYSNLAIFYLNTDEYEMARKYFYKYLEIAESIGDKTSISAALGNLAILYLRIKEYDKAEQHLLRAEKIIKELGNKQLLATAYNYLAEIKRLKHERPENALEYLNLAWDLAQGTGNKAGQADCALNFAKLYAGIGKLKKAEEYMEKADELFVDLGRIRLLQDAYYNYAEILKEIGEKKLAAAYRKKAEALARKSK